MREAAFQRWLARRYSAEVTATRLANVRRVEATMGDLDVRYRCDQLRGVMQRLDYSRADEDAALPNHTGIAIAGDVRNGLATLKSAVNLYRSFSGEHQS